MSNPPRIFRIAAAPDGSLTLAPASPLPTGVFTDTYTVYTICEAAGAVYLAAYAPAAGNVDFYRLSAAAPWLERATFIHVGAKWDQLEALTSGNLPCLMLYQRQNGHFGFFPLDAKLNLAASYPFYRSHAPGLSAGFTTVKPFVLANSNVLIGYDFDTGAVAMYTLAITARSPAGTAPLLATAVWDHQWAKGWTHFAFFQFGGENFFLKTNTLYPNVNIDHVLDDPAAGTAEVATQMQLAEADKLTLVEPLMIGTEEIPHFVACRDDGAAVLYRIHSNCLGWTQVGAAALPAGPVALVPFRLGSEAFLLVL